MGAQTKALEAAPGNPSGIKRGPALARQAGVAMLVLVAYVALEWISLIHEYKGIPTTPWNPGLGVVFAVIMLAGPRAGLVLFAGVVVSEVLFLPDFGDVLLTVTAACMVAVCYTGAAQAARRTLGLNLRLVHLRDILILLGAGLAGAIAVSVLETLLLVASNQIEIADIRRASLPLAVGDVIGIAVVTPLLLRLARRSHGFQRDRAHLREAALFALVILAAVWSITGIPGVDGPRFFYVLFLPVVAAAVRHGIDGACIALAAVQVGLVAFLHAYGYDARAFTEYQMLMLVLTASGLIVGVVVTERRNTDRVLHEAQLQLKEKEAEAAQAARFSLVSSMASALAHEINQPMTAARALARTAQHILATPEGDRARAEKNLGALITQIDHAGEVVGRIREFLRRGEPHVSTIGVADVLRDAIQLIEREAASEGIRIVVAADRDLPDVFADRVQLQQVVLNVVRNAMDAITAERRANGLIRISATRRAAPPAIEIAVLDNGPGIDEKTAARLFQPLATSKSEGLGLGLAICASIIESHGGRIWLHSGAPGATEFRFSLPVEQPRTTDP